MQTDTVTESGTNTASPETTESPDEPTMQARERMGLRQLANDDRGQVQNINPGMLVSLAVALGIGALMFEVLLLPFTNDLAGANSDNLTGNQQTVADLLPLFLMLAAALVLIGSAMKQADLI